MEQENYAVIFNQEPSAPPPYRQSQRYGQTEEHDQPQGYAQPQGSWQPGGCDKTQECMQSKGNGQPVGPEIITRQIEVAYATPGTFARTSSERPPDRSWLAWIVCLCCFWPTGIFAIIYAGQANNEPDNSEAWKKFRLANGFTIASLVCGLIAIVFAIWRVMVYFY